MKNLIKKILREEEGFLDSNEEDWKWANNTPEWDEKIHKGQNYHYIIPANTISEIEWEGIQDLKLSLGLRHIYSNYDTVNKGVVLYVDVEFSSHTENFMPLTSRWEVEIEEGSIEIPLQHLLLLSKNK